ncbi:MAG: hypothetical protein AB8B63_03300 [Granulosicoccus sp.]
MVVPLEEADVLPSPEEVNREKSRVAILPLELFRGQSQVANAESQSLEPALRSELEASLLASGKVDLTDRNLASRLQGALIEYEKRKGEPPKPFQQADYLIISQIDLAAMESDYRAKTENSEGRTLPSICIRNAEVSGVLKVYGIKENQIEAITEISGSKRDVTEAPECADLDVKQARQLYQQATQDAVNGSKRFFREFFAPRGYISEKRTDGKGWVFKVSAPGPAMAEYKTVKIFERRLTENPLTKQFESEVLSIGDARITDQQNEGFVWIYVDDQSVADRVKLGHIVKPDSVGFNPLGVLEKLNL